MTNSYVFDTYTIIEIIRANPNYKPYLEASIVINNFIYAELCYNLLKDNFRDFSILERYGNRIASLRPSLLLEAMQFRYKNKKRKLSMTDCISYMQAQDLGISFLTGDKEFERLKGVEFVK